MSKNKDEVKYVNQTLVNTPLDYDNLIKKLGVDAAFITPEVTVTGDKDIYNMRRHVNQGMNKAAKQIIPAIVGTAAIPILSAEAIGAAPVLFKALSNPAIKYAFDASKNFGRATELLGKSHITGNAGRALVGGTLVDAGYEAITGKPAQLGEALDIQNPHLRFGANMFSPGMFVGGSIENSLVPSKKAFNESAKKFVDYLQGPTIQEAFERFKFEHPDLSEKEAFERFKFEHPDLSEKEAFSKFIEQQSTFTRGVIINKQAIPEQTQKLLDDASSEITGKRLEGGDSLDSGGGLYVSNSYTASDNYSNVKGTESTKNKIGQIITGRISPIRNITSLNDLAKLGISEDQLEYAKNIIELSVRNMLKSKNSNEIIKGIEKIFPIQQTATVVNMNNPPFKISIPINLDEKLADNFKKTI